MLPPVLAPIQGLSEPTVDYRLRRAATCSRRRVETRAHCKPRSMRRSTTSSRSRSRPGGDLPD